MSENNPGMQELMADILKKHGIAEKYKQIAKDAKLMARGKPISERKFFRALHEALIKKLEDATYSIYENSYLNPAQALVEWEELRAAIKKDGRDFTFFDDVTLHWDGKRPQLKDLDTLFEESVVNSINARVEKILDELQGDFPSSEEEQKYWVFEEEKNAERERRRQQALNAAPTTVSSGSLSSPSSTSSPASPSVVSPLSGDKERFAKAMYGVRITLQEVKKQVRTKFIKEKAGSGNANTITAQVGPASTAAPAGNVKKTYNSNVRISKNNTPLQPLPIDYEENEQSGIKTYTLKATLEEAPPAGQPATPFRFYLSKKDKENNLKHTELVVLEMYTFIANIEDLPPGHEVTVNEPYVLIASIARIAYEEYMGGAASNLPPIHGATKFSHSELTPTERKIKEAMISALRRAHQYERLEDRVYKPCQ